MFCGEVSSLLEVVIFRLHLCMSPLLDYLQASVIDCDVAMDVDDGWVLSGVHRSPTPHATIVTASLPLDGDYSAYIEAGILSGCGVVGPVASLIYLFNMQQRNGENC